jgi:hypothetical protein
MAVDVVTTIDIARPRGEVAAFAVEPDNVTAWYQNIQDVMWQTRRPLAIGTRLTFVAAFLGRELRYTYEVREWQPGERFVMSTQEGPFPMETTYEWRDEGGGGTTMTLRNCGAPSGFSRIAAPLMVMAIRRANRKDLARLKTLLEARGAGEA